MLMLHYMFLLEILMYCVCLLFLSTSSIRVTINKQDFWLFECPGLWGNFGCRNYDSVCYADVNFMWRSFPDKKIRAFIPIFLSAGFRVFQYTYNKISRWGSEGFLVKGTYTCNISSFCKITIFLLFLFTGIIWYTKGMPFPLFKNICPFACM